MKSGLFIALLFGAFIITGFSSCAVTTTRSITTSTSPGKTTIITTQTTKKPVRSKVRKKTTVIWNTCDGKGPFVPIGSTTVKITMPAK